MLPTNTIDSTRCRWCSTTSSYNEDSMFSWGTVSDCFEDPETVDIDTINPMYTLGGCECLKEWKVFGHAPCTSYCCSPRW